jgi:hypothetical protein
MKYKRLYIAYGSNINLEQMAYRCPNSKVVGTRMIPDYELEFRGVATIVPKEGAEVPVLLWEIDQRDEISLDRYEGFPRMYRKELFEVEVDGKIREGMKNLLPETTKIIIAQRINSIQHADKIVVLNDGKIDDIGTHDELLSRNEIYKEVYVSQQESKMEQ